MAATLISLGAILLLGLLADTVGRRTRVPRVTLLILLGFAIGPAGVDLMPKPEQLWLMHVTPVALVMVGFLLGGHLTVASMRAHGRQVVAISLAVLVATTLIVTLGLLLAGVALTGALLLGAIATATDPAASADVVRQTRADGPFARTLLGIVAVDDAWGIMLFSIALATVVALTGAGGTWEALGTGAWELSGAFLVGIGLGLPLAFVSGRVRPGETTMVEMIGAVLLCAGIAMWLEVSYLLAAMVMGVVVVNTARHHRIPFHAIGEIEWPVLVLFFVLAGASLEVDQLPAIGVAGVAFLVLRVLGRIVGGAVGAAVVGAPPAMRRWMGLALMPQAGVALGMALVAAERFPEEGLVILPVAIASTVVFELLGPVLTRLALVRVGEA